MEVVAEAGVHAQQQWGQFKEEVEIMEEEHGGGGGADAVEELLTREIRKRLDLAHDHGSSNGNSAHHANVGEEEDHARDGGEGEAVEEQHQHKSIFFDPAKGESGWIGYGADDVADAVERLGDGVAEVVDGGDGVALLQQLQHRVRADEARAARHQHAPAGPGRSPDGEIHEHLDVEEGMSRSAWIW